MGHLFPAMIRLREQGELQFRFQYGDKWLELNPLNRNETAPVINGDTITYPNIYNGIDSQYIVGSDSLKENIILNNFTGINTFSYDLEEHNLTHKLESDGTISFFDQSTGELAFSMDAPLMYDANNAESRNLSLKLEEINNKTVITLEADSTWLNAPERAYPVVLDPNVILNEGVKNTFVSRSSDQSKDSQNFKNEIELQVGYWYDPSYNVTSRSFLNFDVKNNVKLATNAQLLSSTLKMTRLSYTGQDVSPRVFKVTQGWEESAITWNNQPTAETIEVGPLLSTKDNLFSYDVKSAVNDWLFNAQAENGFLLKSFDETVHAMNYFYSSRFGSNVPQLEVEWMAPYFASYSADFPTVMLTGQTITLPVSVSNGGSNLWSAGGANPVKLSYHWEQTDGTPVDHTPLETSLPYDLNSGQAILLQTQIQAPATAGKYKLRIDMKEGANWLKYCHFF